MTRFAFPILLAFLLLLSGCGDFPRPFEGAPGATAMRLALPPPPRLAVPTPANALLTDAGAKRFADAVADALIDKEVPAVAGPSKKGDWRLVISANLQGSMVLPVFTVLDPAGQAKGTAQGVPVSADAWQNATPDTLTQAAQAAATPIATLLTSVDAAVKQSNPNSLVNRSARIYLPDVTGAPGDGNVSLTLNMRRLLPQNGAVVQDTAQGADFTVQGSVKTSPAPDNQIRVEISWRVTDAYGKEAGKVTQLNDVPKGTLDHYWGDIALVVAQQAASGINEVINNNIGKKPAQAGDDKAGKDKAGTGGKADKTDKAAPPSAAGTAGKAAGADSPARPAQGS
jgi:hypothetical protein